MSVLPSREPYVEAPDKFVEEFMQTLTPALIERGEFIQWQCIEGKVAAFSEAIEFYQELANRVSEGCDFVSEMADSLLSSDDPGPCIQCAFELLGHTQPEFATRQDDLEVEKIVRSIARGCEQTAWQLAEILRDVGFERILDARHIEHTLTGIQIGLESHRRKNVGGTVFSVEMSKVVKHVAKHLGDRGIPVQVHPEERVTYRGGSKKLDFAIVQEERVRFGLEGNFYTAGGSKPTEIKRAYADLAARLKEVGITLIWLTDGKGYRRMRRSLKDAFTVLPNTYNLRMAWDHLAGDLEAVIGGRPPGCAGA